MIIAAAFAIPIFADEISNALNDTINATNNSSLNSSGNNSSISDNRTLNNTTNSTLTPQQLQKLTETQSKLAALIATIEGLKATYGNNTKAKGLLNALDQFEKQANRLNEEINAFMQNPSINGTDGRINSFVKREAALEHKVSIKQALLLKMGEKAVNSKIEAKIKKNNQKKQKKDNNVKNK
jgi:hypothetical protein